MATLASITDTAQGIANTFGVDWPMLVAQSINFLIVAFVIWKFAFRNVLSTIKEREKQIADSLKNADRIKLELEETEKKAAGNLTGSFIICEEDRHGSSRQSESLH